MPKHKNWKQTLSEIVEQLRTQNRIHAIAVEALLDKKIEKQKEEKDHDNSNRIT
ncbi:hypothetical protein KJ972_00325 [Candidatus Micrarchaeota archaeon]|nr:hypothetical protein [Candidatus Micrarchaeota archaeon]